MNRIFIVLGGSNSGKSSLIRSMLFLATRKSLQRGGRFFLKYNGGLICIFVRGGSFQELVNFCDYKQVIAKLKKYIKKCEDRVRKDNIPTFNILVTFAFEHKNNNLGVKCIEKPLQYLRSFPKNYAVHIVHLRRNIPKLEEVNAFIENNLEVELTLLSKKTTRGWQDVNGRILRDFILRVAGNH
ncbi:MAG: hypothetical protein WC418_05200 [Candidatus Omnitrophota bacterium]|jgi:hypothetical protein